jgi:hypothetical protein
MSLAGGLKVTLDTGLYLAGLAAEAIFTGLLIYRRVFRVLPLFSSYIFWSLLNDAGTFYLLRHYPSQDINIYLTTAVIDSVFVFCVLIELSMSVLRPVRSMLPRGVIVAVAIVIALVCAAIWPLAKAPGLDQLQLPQSRMIFHLQMTFSAVRILFFLALAACSQWLLIGWRDRELQIATGFGFFSLASLTAAFYHLSQTVGSSQYHMVDLMVAASYDFSIAYWIVSFAQEVPERREFTPQMQNFLLAVAGNARSARIALSNSSDTKTQDRVK